MLYTGGLYDMRHQTTDKQKIHVYKIAIKMSEFGLTDQFVSKAVELASVYEGIYDLMAIWEEEVDLQEKDATVEEINKMIKEKSKSILIDICDKTTARKIQDINRQLDLLTEKK
jgi:hypothetical protein